jgi:hypothetical protein
MADDFYEPLPTAVSFPSGLFTKVLPELLSTPDSALITILVTAFLIAFVTRLLTGSDSEPERVDGKDGKTVWLLPYWIPFIGHGYQLQVSQMLDQNREIDGLVVSSIR